MTDMQNPSTGNNMETAAAQAEAPAASAPVLTLFPNEMAHDKAILQDAVESLNQEEAPKAAAAALQQMDTSMLSETDKKTIDTFAEQIDLGNPDHVLLYGAEAQKKIAEFSDSALAMVRTNETGEAGEMMVKLVNEIKGFGDAAEEPKGLGRMFWSAKKAMESLRTKYDTVQANVDNISSSLENHQARLLKDVSMFDRLYDTNTEYFKELTMYILAGEKRLNEVRSTTLEDLKAKATASGDAMDAQRANDLSAACDRFEKKLHDLKLTRQVALQMAPQIRLLQNNNSLLVERIQSTLSNTLPLWKSQIVLAMGLQHSQEALKAQRAVTDMTNDLLKKNAETLKMGTIQTAKEAERGIIDLSTLTQTNQSLIDSINEVMKIQADGRTQRIEAEKALLQMEGELKQKLLEIK